MNFILNKQIKYYTRKTIRWLSLIAVALLIVMTAVFLKYDLVCSVSLAGEQVGYTGDRTTLQHKINDYVENGDGSNPNIAFVQIEYLPEYKEDFMDLLYVTLSNSHYENKMKDKYGMLYDYFEEINTLLKKDQIQCRMENIIIK